MNAIPNKEQSRQEALFYSCSCSILWQEEEEEELEVENTTM